jgi:putative lipoprotein
MALLLMAALGACRQAPPSDRDANSSRDAGAGAATRPPQPEPSVSAGRDPWNNAHARGIEFRAVGQEPGWYLEIDAEREIHFVYDYAEREARMPAPKPIVDGASTTYVSRSGDHVLRVMIEERPCTDTMSGQAFSHTVYVRIDGAVYEGCGQEL